MLSLQDFTGVMFKKKDYMFVIENVSQLAPFILSFLYIKCRFNSIS